MEAAVVSASHGAVGSLIGRLGDLLTGEYKLLKGVKGQILFLKAELETMHVFLGKISDDSDDQPDEQDKCWAKEVRELSYDIEDSVSEFTLHLEHDDSRKPHGFKGLMNRCMKLMTTMNTRRGIAKEFEGIKVRVIEARERRLRYQQVNGVASRSDIRTLIDPNTSTTTTNITAIDRNLLAIYAETSGLVAIEGPRDELIQLMDAEGSQGHQLKVTSIVGFGGLGKTTLANEVYRKLEGKFQCRAFVSVSQKPNIRKLLRTMLSQVGFKAPMDTNMETWDEAELIAALRKFLLEQRYVSLQIINFVSSVLWPGVLVYSCLMILIL
jgi:shikimate kinase